MTPNQIRLVGFLSLPCGRDTRPTTPRPFTAGVFIVRALFTAAILLTLAASAQAQTNYTWDPGNSASGGTDGSGNWGTSAGDWYTTSDAQDWANIASTSANNAIFGEGGTTTNIVTLNTQIDVGLMTFQSMGTGGSYNISGSGTDPLTIYSGITLNPGAGPVTFSSSSGPGVSLGAASTWTNNSSSLLTLNSTFSGATFGLTIAGSGNTSITGVIGTTSGAVTMAGTGILTLSGANTFTGGLLIDSGTVVAGASNSGGLNGAAGPSAHAISLGDSGGSTAATLLANSVTVSNPINLGTTSGALAIGTNGGATAPTFSGGVMGTNNLVLNNSGTGTLTFSTVNLNNAGTITNNGSGTGATTISGGIGSNVTAIVEASTTSPLTISGRLAVNPTSGTALTNPSGMALLKLTGGTSGSGTLFLENNSATAGGITISTGTVSNKTVTNSGTGTGSVLISAAVSAGGIIESSSTSALTISGQLTASSTLTDSSGAAPLTLSGGVTGEVLVLNNNSATAGGITISGPGSVSIAQLTNSGTGGGSALVSAVITDAGVVQNSSASSLLLSGANTYSEGTTVTSGTLLIGISSATSGSGGNSSITSGATGTGPVTVNGGVLDVSTFNLAVGGLNGSGGTVASSSTSIAGSLTIVTSSMAPSSSYSGIIADTTGAGSKTVSVVVGGNGFGTTAGGQTLAGANTYSGGTTITGGDLVVGVSSVTTGSGAALSITSGATGTGLLTINGGFLDLSTFNLTVAGLSGSGGTITTSSTGTPGSLTIVTGATPETYSGSIVQGRINGSKTVSLTVVGTGLQTLAGTNIYSGGTIVIGGALALSGAGTLGQGNRAS